MTRFIFDLDGTITAKETLPLIAKHFNVEDKINALTADTIKGNIPFIESFIKRVYILGTLPVSEIDTLLQNVPLYPKIVKFINDNNDKCIIASGNLKYWVDKLLSKIGCLSYCSDAIIENNKVIKLTEILKKENIVKMYKEKGEKVVFIGDGNNDMEAMRLADVKIASGLTHSPANSILSIADYLVYSEEALCRMLNQLL